MARKLRSCFIIKITRLSNNYQLSTTHTHISEQKWQTCIASAVQYDGHQRNFIIRLNRIIIFITTATPCNHYLISTRHQQLCAAECDHSHCGLMQNVYKPRETSAVLSLRTTTRKHSSATGYGAARWCSTTYYCGGSKSATGVAVYGKLVGMLENYGRLSLIYWSLRQLPLITFQPNSSQLYSRTRWTPFGQVWWAAPRWLHLSRARHCCTAIRLSPRLLLPVYLANPRINSVVWTHVLLA